MKKTLIISGIILLLLIVGMWVYLFVFGVPKDLGDVWAKFGQGKTVEPTIPIVIDEDDTDTTEADNGPLALRQLTTRSTVGAQFVTSDTIRFVERGTGHIYDVNLFNTSEKLVSGTTIPHAVDASFSHFGSSAIITTEDGDNLSSIVGTVEPSGGSFVGKTLPVGAYETSFDEATDTVSYLLRSNSGSSAFQYNYVSDTNTELFSLPLRDVRVLWGDTTYVYTSPSVHHKGALYRVDKNRLHYVVQSGLGLSAISYKDGVVVTKSEKDKLQSEAVEKAGPVSLGFGLYPEKCTSVPEVPHKLYCSAEFSPPSGEYPDDWYKGVVSFSDALWMIFTSNGEVTRLSDFLTESGREIDVAKIGTDPEGKYVWFINKNDDTLWMFDTTL